MKRAKIETTHLALDSWNELSMDSQKEHTVNESLLNSRVHFVFYCVLCPFPLQFHIDCIHAVEQCPPNSSFNLHETIVYPQYVAFRVSKSSYFHQITLNTWHKKRNLVEQKVYFVWTALNFSQSCLRISSEN